MKHPKLILLSSVAFFAAVAIAQSMTLSIAVDDFDNLNSLGSGNNNLDITKSENGLQLDFGPGSSNLGRDAFGTGTSTFGESGEWFDGSYVKFGNSGNQQLLDFRITNNTAYDVKLKNISFDIRRAPTNSNPTGFELKYLATGDSNLVKGATAQTGTEIVDLNNIGSDSVVSGINNFSEFIGSNISGTAWIAAGEYANLRLKMITSNTAASSQLDNFSVTVEAVNVPEPSTFALLLGLTGLCLALQRRPNL